jgi:hypothetical protein
MPKPNISIENGTMPTWLRNALLMDTPKKCENAVRRQVRRLWNEWHPERPRQKRGRKSAMNHLYDGAEAVLKSMMPEEWLLELHGAELQRFKPDEIISTFEGPKKVTRRDLEKLEHWNKLKLEDVITKLELQGYTDCQATIRKYVRCFVHMNLRVHELPHSFRDGRQPWVRGSKTLEELDMAYHAFKGKRPYIEQGFTRFKDYYIPSRSSLQQLKLNFTLKKKIKD